MQATSKFTNPSTGMITSTIGYLHGNSVCYTEDKVNEAISVSIGFTGMIGNPIDSIPLSVEIENASDFKQGESFILYFNASNREQTSRGKLLAIVYTGGTTNGRKDD